MRNSAMTLQIPTCISRVTQRQLTCDPMATHVIAGIISRVTNPHLTCEQASSHVWRTREMPLYTVIHYVTQRVFSEGSRRSLINTLHNLYAPAARKKSGCVVRLLQRQDKISKAWGTT